jgi:hypothetical protein
VFSIDFSKIEEQQLDLGCFEVTQDFLDSNVENIGIKS